MEYVNCRYRDGEIFLFLGGKKNGGWFIFLRGLTVKFMRGKGFKLIKCDICRAFITSVNSNPVMPRASDGSFKKKPGLELTIYARTHQL